MKLCNGGRRWLVSPFLYLESSKTIKSADSEFIKFVDPKLVDQVAEDQLSLSSGSEREVDFWITYDEKFQDKTSFRFDETIIDDDIKNKIHKLTCLDLENNQAMEMNLKYWYSELVRAYEKINTLQIIITSLNKELTKSKANTKQANNYINTLLLAGKQKTKNEGMAAKIKFQSQYHLRLEQIQSKFLHESDFLRKEFYRQRGLFLCKDKLVNKLVRIIVEQELVIEVLKHELKRDVTLHRMKSFDNVFTVHREFGILHLYLI